MEKVSNEKMEAITQAALDETARGIEFLLAQLMKEKNLRADQVEIAQEVTPNGIVIYARERQSNKGEEKP